MVSRDRKDRIVLATKSKETRNKILAQVNTKLKILARDNYNLIPTTSLAC